MAADRGLLRREDNEEAGFTIIEAVVAAGILLIAVILTITPLIVSMRSIDRSKDVTIAETLAQARIEQVRALQFDDIGNPGAAPSGILNPVETEVVEGARFRIETTVQFVGSSSGLNVVPQGGDGVQGAFDVGVNYKYVQVTVTPLDGEARPVTMETFIAPPVVGGLENIAVIQVDVDRHEPFGASLDPEPAVRISGPQTYTSPDPNPSQYFADVALGDYTISLVTTDGWVIHPDSVSSGATSVTAAAGTNALRTIRVYQPVGLDVTVVDDTTDLPIPTAVLTATDQASGVSITNFVGDYSFSGLVPDRYTVDALAIGYAAGSVEVDVPGIAGGAAATTTIRLTPQTFVGVQYDFYVDYGGGSHDYIHGATVTVTHPTAGVFAGTTDATGHVVLELPASTPGFTVVASTPWGHGDDTMFLSTGTGPGSASLSVSKPRGTDRFALRNGGQGPDGFFEYKVGSDPWVRLEANDLGRATFILPEDRGTVVQLRTYCSQADYPGSPAASASTTLNNRNKNWNAGTSC